MSGRKCWNLGSCYQSPAKTDLKAHCCPSLAFPCPLPQNAVSGLVKGLRMHPIPATLLKACSCAHGGGRESHCRQEGSDASRMTTKGADPFCRSPRLCLHTSKDGELITMHTAGATSSRIGTKIPHLGPPYSNGLSSPTPNPALSSVQGYSSQAADPIPSPLPSVRHSKSPFIGSGTDHTLASPHRQVRWYL